MSADSECPTGTPTPRIDIEISFDRSTHSYSQETEPPKVTLTVTSRAEHPLTIFTWRKPLDPKGALTSEGYIITDVTTGQRVRTTKVMVNRTALKRVRGDFDEQFFLTLQPSTPLELSTGFGYGPSRGKPLPYSLIKGGHVLDENGNERSARRSAQATGVDGLEPGHQYTIGLNVESLRSCRWAPVTKDEILVDDNGEGSYLGDYPSWKKDTPLDFCVKEATLSVVE